MEGEGQDHNNNYTRPLLTPPPPAAVFTTESHDIPPISSPRIFGREFLLESKKLWYLAGPAIFTSVCQYSLGAITQLFAGHVGTLELAAVSVENSVIAGFCFGIMLGMGSALETLCGQAFGAGQLRMLGIYMQRSWVILNTTCLILSLLYVFAKPLLNFIGQTAAISKAAGEFAVWMIPQLFAYAMNFPIQKFLQAQSKIMVMAWIAAAALVMHLLLSWLLMLRLGWGLVGAAVVLNGSWWFIVVAQLVYILSGTCGNAWSGFSLKAFENLWGFVRLSLASAVMLWYQNLNLFISWSYAFIYLNYFCFFLLYHACILFLGRDHAHYFVMCFCQNMNILGWTVMVSFGMNAAVSVRVSNELGASHPRAAKFSLVVAVITSFVLGLAMSLVLIMFRKQYPSLFSNDSAVKELVMELTPMLAFCIIINNVQPVLSGVAVGAGWQSLVAYVNIACYYLFGVPLGLILGYALDFGVIGIWSGMLTGTIVQTCVLFIIVYRTDWDKEASLAEDRIKKWGGHKDSKSNGVANNDQQT
ncbi:protein DETOXIFICATION 30 [Arachis ipaensis]|uniref:protein DETOXIFICATION 30 n=1 Tax=Arachis ipaensis TaxID=130454 RepID=UPI000A2AF3CF|nr:protein DETOXIFICATION 30 [Arachis ipaensis]